MKKTFPLLEVEIPGRTCWNCSQIYFSTGEPGYSEYTPGSDMELFCRRDYWEVSDIDSMGSSREKFATAEKCGDYKDYRDGEGVE